MRILILGKDGMLGKDLLKVFEREDLIALNSKDLDVTNREAVWEKFITIQPDVVINATGFTDTSAAEKEPELANKVNGYAVGLLAQACREIDATLIHFSTDYVFDGTKKSGYEEENPTNPINAYGYSKELGEKLLVEEMELQKTPYEKEGKYFIIRTSWLYGKHGKNFVDTMLKLGAAQLEAMKKSLANKTDKEVVQPLKVVNDQHGKPTSTMDLALQVKWLLGTHEYPSGIYHITNEEPTTWYDFARAIFDLSNMPVSVVPCSSKEYPSVVQRPQHSILLNTKLPSLRPWKEALKEYLYSLR